jgi:hypothetical protein
MEAPPRQPGAGGAPAPPDGQQELQEALQETLRATRPKVTSRAGGSCAGDGRRPRPTADAIG